MAAVEVDTVVLLLAVMVVGNFRSLFEQTTTTSPSNDGDAVVAVVNCDCVSGSPPLVVVISCRPRLQLTSNWGRETPLFPVLVVVVVSGMAAIGTFIMTSLTGCCAAPLMGQFILRIMVMVCFLPLLLLFAIVSLLVGVTIVVVGGVRVITVGGVFTRLSRVK